MPKPKTELREKLLNYCKEFGNILSINGLKLFCNCCEQEIKKAFKRNSILQHFRTQKHFQNSNNFQSIEENIDLNEDKQQKENHFIESDFIFSEKVFKVLLEIKERVKEFLNENKCKCDQNIIIKNDFKVLLEKYETTKQQNIKLNESKAKNEINKNFEVKREINSNKSKQILKNKVLNKRRKVSVSQRNTNKELYSCCWPGCDQTFDIQSKLRYHFRKHTGEKKYLCDWPNCGRAYNRLSVYEYHKEIHRFGGHKKSIECEWDGCEKRFAFRFHMLRHLRVNHLRITKFKCQYQNCEQGFPNRDQLDIHIGQVHLGHNLYACDWPNCDKRYKTRCHLQVFVIS